jgi:hypothetical protein
MNDMRFTLARGAADERCQLTASPIARRFRKGSGLNTFAADLFEAIAAGSGTASLPQVDSSVPEASFQPKEGCNM